MPDSSSAVGLLTRCLQLSLSRSELSLRPSQGDPLMIEVVLDLQRTGKDTQDSISVDHRLAFSHRDPTLTFGIFTVGMLQAIPRPLSPAQRAHWLPHADRNLGRGEWQARSGQGQSQSQAQTLCRKATAVRAALSWRTGADRFDIATNFAVAGNSRGVDRLRTQYR